MTSSESLVDTSHEKIMVLKDGIEHQWDYLLAEIGKNSKICKII